MKRIVWDRLGSAERAEALRRPSRAIAERTRADVAAIFDDVRGRGDEALRDLTEKLDGARLDDLRAGAVELLSAEGALTAPVRRAVADAASRIDRFHRAALAPEVSVETAPGMLCERIARPIRRVGLYVPAGTAPLPSTALMLGVPARVAGCRDVVMCTPPRPDGSADPAVLFAALTCGVTRVLKLGGAQAIAAMALGTESVPACDKLFGPGNAWVAEAKRQAALLVDGPAIDLPAGPSELLVIADSGADPVFVAADLLSQAEHGPDSQVLLVSDDARLLESVEAELETQMMRLPRGAVAARSLAASRTVLVDRLDDAFDISNDYAPEHLLLAVREPRRWLGRVESAGSVFLGAWTPQALGDYCSGTNHVLPTGGAARAWSGLSVASFQKAISVQTADRAAVAAIGPTAVALARAEGLDAHARAVEVRLERRAP